jgi:hypothetical protein
VVSRSSPSPRPRIRRCSSRRPHLFRTLQGTYSHPALRREAFCLRVLISPPSIHRAVLIIAPAPWTPQRVVWKHRQSSSRSVSS